MKKITVLFFATLRDHMGAKKIEMELPEGVGISGLKKTLIRRVPGAAVALDNALVSINREYSFGEETIPDGAEVAFFPYVSGG